MFWGKQHCCAQVQQNAMLYSGKKLKKVTKDRFLDLLFASSAWQMPHYAFIDCNDRDYNLIPLAARADLGPQRFGNNAPFLGIC